MKHKILIFAVLLVGLASMAPAQTAISATSLAAAMDASTPSIKVASTTGITIAQAGQPVTYAYIDQELVGIMYQTALPSQPTVYSVLRGQFGTKAHAHSSGDMVLISATRGNGPGAFSSPGAGGFQQSNPPINGTCSGNLWVNVLTAAQWLCSSVTGTWVPGWNNPLAAQSPGTTAAVASASAITPSGPLFHLTGTTGITSFTIPVGFNATAAGAGQFCYINDSTASTTAGNNIGATITGVANTRVCWAWDAANSKFYPVQ
jgi:hypothetical protein